MTKGNGKGTPLDCLLPRLKPYMKSDSSFVVPAVMRQLRPMFFDSYGILSPRDALCGK